MYVFEVCVCGICMCLWYIICVLVYVYMCVGYLYVYMVYVYGKIVQTLATSFIEF